MANKGGLFVNKKEMTRVYVGNKLVPVTLVTILNQKIIRYKTLEKDGYSSVVIGVEKKTLNKKKGVKISYKKVGEFINIDKDFNNAYPIEATIDQSILEGVETVSVVGISKGKGFQGAMKRFNLKGGPKTHGSKFHRQVGSMGNRKPRRTQKGHPHAGRMGTDQITLKKVKVIDVVNNNGEQVIVLKGPIPGHYNATLKIAI